MTTIEASASDGGKPESNGSMKSTGRRNLITNILVDRLSRPRMVEAAVSLCCPSVDFVLSDEMIDGLSETSVGGLSDDALSVRLFNTYKSVTEDADFVECAIVGQSGCGGRSPVVLDSCPYCGAADDVPDVIPSTNPEATVEAKPSAKKAKSSAKKTTVEAKPSAKKTKSSAKVATVEANPAPVASQALAALTVRTSEALVNAGKVLTESDLDEHVVAFQKLKSTLAGDYWVTANAIAWFHDTKSYMLRRDSGGLQKYKTFDSFCHSELGMPPNTARSMAAVAMEFTESEYREFGRSRLTILVQTRPDKREEIKAVLGSGAPKREILAAVRKANAELREGGEMSNAAGTSDKWKNRTKPAAKQVTVANILGNETVKLFKGPAPKRFDEKSAIRARSIGDDPFGVHQLTNGVLMNFRLIKSSSGELSLKITTVREE